MSLSDFFMDSEDLDFYVPASRSASPSLAGRQGSDSDFCSLTDALTSEPSQRPASESSYCQWQADSFLIFQAEDGGIISDNGIICRYPQSPFASKSGVFNEFLRSENHDYDLFYRGKHVSGDPLITLVGVSNGEAKHFLSALYDASFFEGPPNQTSLEVVISVFKLSSKYEVLFLRRRALKHLELAFPHKAQSNWDARTEAPTFDIQRDEYPGAVSRTLTGTLEVIEVCILYAAPWVLPAAFYEVCLYDIKSLLAHPKWMHGTLAADIKNKILLGYLNHREKSSQVLSFLHIGGLGSCTNDPVCVDYRREVLGKIYTDPTQRRGMQDFLGEVWDDGDWEEADMNGFCENCLRICQARHGEARSDAWARLPGIYELQEWEDLAVLRENDPAMCS